MNKLEFWIDSEESRLYAKESENVEIEFVELEKVLEYCVKQIVNFKESDLNHKVPFAEMYLKD